MPGAAAETVVALEAAADSADAAAGRAAATAREKAVSSAAAWVPFPGAMAVVVAAPWVARSYRPQSR